MSVDEACKRCATYSNVRASGSIRLLTSSAFDILRGYLEARAPFETDDFDLIRTVFLFKRLSAGEFLQRAGDVTRHAAFVASGCLRNYVIDAKGKEHIVQFAPETWWLADATSLNSDAPSTYFIDTIEDSELLLIDAPSHQMLVDRMPAYAAERSDNRGRAFDETVDDTRRFVVIAVCIELMTVGRVEPGCEPFCCRPDLDN